MKRRALLSVTGAVVTAGCQALQMTNDEPIRLGTIHLANHLDQEKQFEIEIRANGDVVHETVVTLPGTDSPEESAVLLDHNWPAEAQSYTLRFNADVQPEPLEIALEEPNVEACESFIIRLRPGSIDAFQSTDGECYDEQ